MGFLGTSCLDTMCMCFVDGQHGGIFEAEAGKMLRRPYFELRPDEQRWQLTLAQRVVLAILKDPAVSFRRDATVVVSLVGGSMHNAGEVKAAAANINRYAFDVLRRAHAMKPSMGQTLRLPRRSTRDELYDARRAITPYTAVAVSVRAHGGKKRAAVVVSLADLVGEQVRLAQEQGVFTPPRGTSKIPVLVCTDARPLWRAAATRCYVFVGVRPRGPASAGNRDNCVTCWVMDGSDHSGCLYAMDAEARLNWGAFLRAILPPRCVGDYAHATDRLCNATQIRLQQDVSYWVQEGDGRGVIGRLKDVWGDLICFTKHPSSGPCGLASNTTTQQRSTPLT